MERITLNTTLDEVETFLKSPLWFDMKQELEAWKEGFNRELNSIVDDAATNNPSTASVLMHMGDLNGRQKAVDYLLSLPDLFLSLLEEKKDGRNKAD